VLAAVVGGNLQGTEAVYLSKKAGWEVLLIDKNPVAPASGLCDRFIQFDVTSEKQLGNALKGVELVIPALENEAALISLDRCTKAENIPFAFDLEAYSISSSKLKSDRLFARNKVPIPRSWPNCGFPVVAKPDVGSGSHGVMVFREEVCLQKYLENAPADVVLQEFIQGPSYSLEVLGVPGQYTPLQVTGLEMDENYDCKRVLAPTDLSDALTSEFEGIADTLAHAIELRGLMDVEVILHEGVLKVLEIDARLPSQTPTAVFWSTGLNMVRMLGDLFVSGSRMRPKEPIHSKGVIYEHIQVSPNMLKFTGEGIMSRGTPLRIQSNFFGADEAITNYTPNYDEWVATLIVCEKDRDAAMEKRNRVIADIQGHFNIEMFWDPSSMKNAKGKQT
jgi:pyrrolysine biosynthesis protein PylC